MEDKVLYIVQGPKFAFKKYQHSAALRCSGRLLYVLLRICGVMFHQRFDSIIRLSDRERLK